MRTVKIEEYWPLIVKNTEEFGQIATAENPEFNRLAECIYNVLKDSFIQDATEYGVSRWENMLGLAVTPDMSLEDRKVAILTYLSVKLPYTWRVLKQMLTGLLGEDNFTFVIDNDTQTLNIALASTVESMREKIDELCARVIPQNLVIEYDQGLPIDYTRVEYLESTGKQWIAVAGAYTHQVRFGLTFSPTRLSDMNYFAGRNHNYYMRVLIANETLGLGQIPNASIIGFTPSTQDVYNVDVDHVSRVSTITCAGETKKMYIGDGGYQLATRPLVFFGGQGSVQLALNEVSYRAYAKIWEAYIYEAGVKTHDFIPALDPTGTPCMFDTVTRTPFYNLGTGDFTYPTDAAPAVSADLDEKFYAKRTEHGIRRLYQVPKGYTGTKDEYAAEHGFKELVEPPMPLDGYWTNVWRETETQLICEWVETEPPMEEGAENE